MIALDSLEDLEAALPTIQQLAKDKWGEQETKPLNQFTSTIVKQGWQYHLAQLVTEVRSEDQ